jgi:hypothetical protein
MPGFDTGKPENEQSALSIQHSALSTQPKRNIKIWPRILRISTDKPWFGQKSVKIRAHPWLPLTWLNAEYCMLI